MISVDQQRCKKIEELFIDIGLFIEDKDKKITKSTGFKFPEFKELQGTDAKTLFDIAILVNGESDIKAAAQKTLEFIQKKFPNYKNLSEEEKLKQFLPLIIDVILQSLNAANLFSLKGSSDVVLTKKDKLEKFLGPTNFKVEVKDKMKASEFLGLLSAYYDSPDFLCRIYELYVALSKDESAFAKGLLDAVFKLPDQKIFSDLRGFDISSYYLSSHINEALPEDSYHKAFLYFSAATETNISTPQKINLIAISEDQISVSNIKIKLHSKDGILEVSKQVPIKKTGNKDTQNALTLAGLKGDIEKIVKGPLISQLKGKENFIYSNGPMGRPVLADMEAPIPSNLPTDPIHSLMIIDSVTAPPKENQMIIGLVSLKEKDMSKLLFTAEFPNFTLVEDISNADLIDIIAKLSNKDRKAIVEKLSGKDGKKSYTVVGYQGNKVLEFVKQAFTDQKDPATATFPLADLLAGLNFNGNLLMLQEDEKTDNLLSVWNENDREVKPEELNISVKISDYVNAVYGNYFSDLLMRYKTTENQLVKIPVSIGKTVYIIRPGNNSTSTGKKIEDSLTFSSAKPTTTKSTAKKTDKSTDLYLFNFIRYDDDLLVLESSTGR